jgi:hypothetical protein
MECHADGEVIIFDWERRDLQQSGFLARADPALDASLRTTKDLLIIDSVPTSECQ